MMRRAALGISLVLALLLAAAVHGQPAQLTYNKGTPKK